MSGSDVFDAGLPVSQWSAWKSGVESGDLAVDVDVARGLVTACVNYLEVLEDSLDLVDFISEVGGMGTLQSGKDLARKFSLKALGGDDSLEKSLLSHIAVVNEMRDYFQACVARYFAADSDNADRIARQNLSGS